MASKSTPVGNHQRKWIMLVAIISLTWQGCEQGTRPEERAEEVPELMVELPYENIPLTSLVGLETKGENWQIVGSVVSDFQERHHIGTTKGTGVLLNQQTPEQKAHIFTGFDHGDIELDIEFLMPKGSNSGIYFQSRYEIQLYDSWMVEALEPKDCGSIYERWDPSKPDGQQGYEGHPPRINAAKAPGLWQHFHIKFRAPRFDANGNKTANAVFEEVIHNGVTIHENVEVTGPTRAAITDDSEVPVAPLMIQGDHGPVAFRNIQFKLYQENTLSLSNLTYDYYEIEDTYEKFPPLDSIPVVSSDTTSSMNIDQLSKRQNGVAFSFKGNLNVTVPGDHLFFLSAHNGARLFIDNNEVVSEEEDRALTSLTAGTHDIRLDYYNTKWRKSLVLEYEGPKQQRTTLERVGRGSVRREPEPLHVDPLQDQAEMVRSFVSYGNDKRTHAISVGDPARIHYSYDLESGSLLQVWRGGFADMSRAWVGRGPTQLLLPQGMAVPLIESIISEKGGRSNETATEALDYQGYAIDESGRPAFRYTNSVVDFEDAYRPSPDGRGLIRSLSNHGETTMTVRVGVGDFIEEVRASCFVINGNHYLEMMGGPTPLLKESDGRQEMLLEVTPKTQVSYAIIW
ncbi:MAG: family 16 glycoside hydrolase [Bacteroidota bacterium]